MFFRLAGRHPRIIFISSNRDWGGSEQLWSGAAAALALQGCSVAAYVERIFSDEPPIQQLRSLSCPVRELGRIPLLPYRCFWLLSVLARPLAIGIVSVRALLALLFRRPDLVVLSQGGNHDGVVLANICRVLKLPYVLIIQKATEMQWPNDRRLHWMRRAYAGALRCFFVSEHNRRLTQEQLGTVLLHAGVVRNPFLVAWERSEHWPDAGECLRLACVGRLYPTEKGQDILLRVLAQEKWRRRPVSVTFYGVGPQRQSLEQMADLLGVTVSFAGHVRDVAAIWDLHHALVLPSRSEGLPLVIVEAMMSGRVPIVTGVAGNAELIEDGETGFVARAANEDGLDEAMERAWAARDHWRAMGDLAAERIRARVPRDPAATFAESLLVIAKSCARVPYAESQRYCDDARNRRRGEGTADRSA